MEQASVRDQQPFPLLPTAVPPRASGDFPRLQFVALSNGTGFLPWQVQQSGSKVGQADSSSQRLHFGFRVENHQKSPKQQNRLLNRPCQWGARYFLFLRFVNAYWILQKRRKFAAQPKRPRRREDLFQQEFWGISSMMPSSRMTDLAQLLGNLSKVYVFHRKLNRCQNYGVIILPAITCSKRNGANALMLYYAVR